MATLTYYYRTSNPDDGLQAMLKTRPEEVISWVENAPLRLIGAALADMQGTGKAGDLHTGWRGRSWSERMSGGRPGGRKFNRH